MKFWFSHSDFCSFGFFLVFLLGFFFLPHALEAHEEFRLAECYRGDPADLTSFTFYVTFHEDVENIYQYNENGTFLMEVFSTTSSLKELRGMVLLPDGNLLVANAYEGNSKVVTSFGCGIEQIPETLTSQDLSHPYGLALGINPNLSRNGTILYVSNQDTLEVTYYVLTDLENGPKVVDHGIFGPQNFFEQIRGIAMYPRTQELIVADESLDKVYFLSLDGAVNRSIKVTKPIGTYVSGSVLYVSSNSNSHPAAYSFDLETLKQIREFQTPKVSDLGHPCGIASCQDRLLVLGQDTQSLFVFNSTSGDYLQTLVTGFSDTPEQIITLNCWQDFSVF